MERTPKAEEAILLASDPHRVRDYLEKRSQSPRYSDSISAEAEALLLDRKSRLIDLSLAEFCRHKETAHILFKRSAGDWPLRAMLLSNQSLSKADWDPFPVSLFASYDEMIEYLKTITPDERHVLFRNPTLSDSFLEQFLSLEKPWCAMEIDQRLQALADLSANEKLHRSRSTADYEDGFDWYLAGKPFEAAWALIAKLEPTEQNAKHLAILLNEIPGDSYKREEIRDALPLWRSAHDQSGKESAMNKKGQLSDFQIVRQSGARLLSGGFDTSQDDFLQHDDLAYRCGAYETYRNPTAEVIRAAIERDGDLARLYLIRNSVLWQSDKKRRLIRDLILRDAKADRPGWEYDWQYAKYKKSYPNWFKDEEEDRYESHSSENEKVISESSISEIVDAFTSSLVLRSIERKIINLEHDQRNIKLLVLSVLACGFYLIVR